VEGYEKAVALHLKSVLYHLNKFESSHPFLFDISVSIRARKRWGRREYLNASKTRELKQGLDELFEGMVEVPRIRHGSRQTLETLIGEEAQLLAKYLRDERKTWVPRIVS
jgi:hypothetical protein